MTESEALGKYCLSSMAGDTMRSCKGSKCMAWRWDNVYNIERNGNNTVYHPKPDEERTGFCGMAGRPL